MSKSTTLKHICSYCGRQVTKLSRHIKTKHPHNQNDDNNNMIPQTLKQFTEMLSLFPLKTLEWKTLCRYGNSIDTYLQSGKSLPDEAFCVLFQAFERYKLSKNKNNKLLGILNLTSARKHIKKKSINKMSVDSRI